MEWECRFLRCTQLATVLRTIRGGRRGIAVSVPEVRGPATRCRGNQQAITPSLALRDYESRVIKYSDELMDQMKAFSGKPVNASLWLNFYSFDVMGDLAFGESFNMLRSGERVSEKAVSASSSNLAQHHALEVLAKGMEPVGLFTPIPWIFPILHSIPGLGAGLKEFIDFGDAQVAARKQVGNVLPGIRVSDLFHRESPTSLTS